MPRAAPNHTAWSSGSTGRGPRARRWWFAGTTVRRCRSGSATPTGPEGTHCATRRSTAEAVAPSRAAAPKAATTSRRWAPPWAGREITPAKRCSSSTARPAGAPALLELEAAADIVGPTPPESLVVGERRAGRLGRTGGGPGDAGAASRVHSGLVHVAADVGSPAREGTEQLRPDARHFCRTARAAGPPHAERRGQPGAQVGLVDRRGGQAMRGDPPPVTGTPAAVRTVDEVRHHDVAVDVRIAVSADAMREHGRDGAAGGQHRAGGTRSPGGGDGVLFQIRKRPRDGLVVHGHDRARRLGTGQCEEHAGRLRRTEGQIERGHGHASRSEHDPRSADGGSRAVAGTRQPARGRRGRAPPPRSRPTGPVRPRAAPGRDRTGSSRTGPVRSRGSRAWWPPVTQRTGGVNGRPATSSGGAPRPGSPASSPSRSRRSRAAPPPARRRGGRALVPR